MDNAFVVGLTALSQHIQALTGGRLLWVDADPELRNALPQVTKIHGGAACMAVKSDPDRRAKCLTWCSAEGRRPDGRGTCHAGLIEWRWPIRFDGIQAGWAFLGVFAPGDPDLPSPPSAQIIAAIRGVIELAVVGLREARAIERGAVAEQVRHPCLQAVIDRLVRAPSYAEGADDLAAHARISPGRLQHLCRDQLDCSLRELRDRHLLRWACGQLMRTTQPIFRIAAALGFRDQQAFATWFRLQTGRSPSAWRAGGSEA